jgi:hypothetical protein
MLDIKQLSRDEWRALRDIRLRALGESPYAFLATYVREEAFDETRWRAEFDRGDWRIGFREDKPVILLQRLKGQHLGLYGGWGSRVSPRAESSQCGSGVSGAGWSV